MKNTAGKKRDWSEQDLKKIIVEQRKFMWLPETIERIAACLKMTRGFSIADIGCGLGYLGWTFRDHFGSGGTYTGLDCSEKLLREAKSMSSGWSREGRASFLSGSAYDVPLSDGSFDVTMCQTLLMHLEDPMNALKEMVRITKPGGAVMCMEPDNLFFGIPFSSMPEQSMEELLYFYRARLIWARGQKKLGKGDCSIGSKVPKMMADSGLEGIEIKLSDRSRFVQPPYETEFQKYTIEQAIERIENRDEEEEKRSWKRYRERYIAGGGSKSSCYRFKKFVEKRRAEMEPVVLQQLKAGTYYRGYSGSNFMCFMGFKPGPGD